MPKKKEGAHRKVKLESIDKFSTSCSICFQDLINIEEGQTGKLRCGHIFYNFASCSSQYFEKSDLYLTQLSFSLDFLYYSFCDYWAKNSYFDEVLLHVNSFKSKLLLDDWEAGDLHVCLTLCFRGRQRSGQRAQVRQGVEPTRRRQRQVTAKLHRGLRQGEYCIH